MRARFAIAAVLLSACPPPTPDPVPTCPLSDREWATIDGVKGSVAQRWLQLAVAAIRTDPRRPHVNARTLFHLSAAMYDAWATYVPEADGVFFEEKTSADDVETARGEAVSVAARHLLRLRYARAPGGSSLAPCFDLELEHLGLHADSTSAAASVGQRIGDAVEAATRDDGANEQNDYAETVPFTPRNQPLLVSSPGGVIAEPDSWQPLEMSQAVSQGGGATSAVQTFVGAGWGVVAPFALVRSGGSAGLYVDAGAPPSVHDSQTRDAVMEVLQHQVWLEDADALVELSPATQGANTLGHNDGHGHALNPVTQQPYAPTKVSRADFGRVVAEFWGNGPRFETQPGLWNLLAMEASNHALATHLLEGAGPPRAPLEWDVKLALALNAAQHDALVATWELKARHATSRPISLVRWFATRGQSSDPRSSPYSPDALPQVPGVYELVTRQTNGPGQRHEGLPLETMVAFQRRHDGHGGAAWETASSWLPYQRSTVVSPPWPGFVSEDSASSRAAAEVLTAATGSAFFPGGLGSFVAARDAFLSLEPGPRVDVPLQWATYFDAADQAGRSRVWAGVQLSQDDLAGRNVGHIAGQAAWAKAKTYFDGTAR